MEAKQILDQVYGASFRLIQARSEVRNITKSVMDLPQAQALGEVTTTAIDAGIPIDDILSAAGKAGHGDATRATEAREVVKAHVAAHQRVVNGRVVQVQDYDTANKATANAHESAQKLSAGRGEVHPFSTAASATGSAKDATTKAHLSNGFEHHMVAAAAHRRASDLHHSCSKIAGRDEATAHEDLASHHRRMADHHEAMAYGSTEVAAKGAVAAPAPAKERPVAKAQVHAHTRVVNGKVVQVSEYEDKRDKAHAASAAAHAASMNASSKIDHLEAIAAHKKAIDAHEAAKLATNHIGRQAMHQHNWDEHGDMINAHTAMAGSGGGDNATIKARAAGNIAAQYDPHTMDPKDYEKGIAAHEAAASAHIEAMDKGQAGSRSHHSSEADFHSGEANKLHKMKAQRDEQAAKDPTTDKDKEVVAHATKLTEAAHQSTNPDEQKSLHAQAAKAHEAAAAHFEAGDHPNKAGAIQYHKTWAAGHAAMAGEGKTAMEPKHPAKAKHETKDQTDARHAKIMQGKAKPKGNDAYEQFLAKDAAKRANAKGEVPQAPTQPTKAKTTAAASGKPEGGHKTEDLEALEKHSDHHGFGYLGHEGRDSGTDLALTQAANEANVSKHELAAHVLSKSGRHMMDSLPQSAQVQPGREIGKDELTAKHKARVEHFKSWLTDPKNTKQYGIKSYAKDLEGKA